MSGRALGVDEVEVHGPLGLDDVPDHVGDLSNADVELEDAVVPVAEPDDDGPAQWRQGGADRVGAGLRLHLSAALGDLSVKPAVDVGVVARGVVVVTQAGGLVAVEVVEMRGRGAIRLRESQDGVAIQGHGDGLPLAYQGLQVRRRNVVVVVIRPAAVAAKLIQLARQEGVGAPVVLDGIEDGDAVGGDGDGAAKEVFLGGDRQLGGDGEDGDGPAVRARVALWQRHLLLPRRDPHHQPVGRQAVGLHPEVPGIPTGGNLGAKPREDFLEAGLG